METAMCNVQITLSYIKIYITYITYMDIYIYIYIIFNEEYTNKNIKIYKQN